MAICFPWDTKRGVLCAIKAIEFGQTDSDSLDLWKRYCFSYEAAPVEVRSLLPLGDQSLIAFCGDQVCFQGLS